MPKDINNNLIDVCLFESYLAHFFITHPELFAPILDKLEHTIESVLALNEGNVSFQRNLYSVFSLVMAIDPAVIDYDALKKRHSLVAYDTFLKYFTENVLTSSHTKLPPMPAPAMTKLPSLSVLSQRTLFQSSNKGAAILESHMRDPRLYASTNRGVIESQSISEEETCKLGILQEIDTPEDLKNVFQHPYTPAQFDFRPDEGSTVAKWLRKHHLPIIAGTSGSVSKMFSQWHKLMFFTADERQLLALFTASCMIARGHHSFFEVMLPASRLGRPLAKAATLFEFYEQCLPASIKASPEYQRFMASDKGRALILAFSLGDIDYTDEVSGILRLK